MEIVIDGSRGMAAGGEGVTFRDVFEKVRRETAARRRIVVGYTLNGEPLTEERRDALADQVPAGNALLEVRTADPYVMAGQTLSGLRGHLDNMERSLGAAADQYRAGQYARALEKFEEGLHAWEILVRAVRDVGQLLAADFLRLTAQGETIDLSLRRLQAALLRFETALETKDVPRLHDLSREELLPHLSRWREVVSVLQEQAARGAAGPGA